MLTRKDELPLVLCVGVLLLGILGGLTQTHSIVYSFFAYFIAVPIFFVTGFIRGKWLPLLIFCMALGILYNTTLVSNYVMGTDIHLEYYYADKFSHHSWDTGIHQPFTSSILITVILPLLSKLPFLNLYWAMKVIPPIFLACVPVALYFLFKELFGKKTAFLSTFFVMSITSYFMEVPGIVKMQVGEILFVLVIVLLVTNKLKWSFTKKLVILLLLCTLTAFIHYTVWSVMLLFLGISLVVLVPYWYFTKKQLATIVMILVLFLTSGGIGTIYLYSVADGSAMKNIVDLGRYFTGKEHHYAAPPDTWGVEVERTDFVEPTGVKPARELIGVSNQDSIVKVATGADFFDTNKAGKGFRLFQIITQILIGLGALYMILNWRKFNPKYIAFTFAAFVILLFCIIIPGFTSVLNASRWYHVASLVFAPLLILGWKYIFKKESLVLVVLIPYFLFTSGIVFEVTEQPNVASITTPYNFSLSGNRVDLNAIETHNDRDVVEYARDNNTRPLITDLDGYAILEDVWGKEGGFTTFKDDVGFNLKEGFYIFLREVNVEKQQITYWHGIGKRIERSFDDTDFWYILNRCTLVYQSGNALLLQYQG